MDEHAGQQNDKINGPPSGDNATKIHNAPSPREPDLEDEGDAIEEMLESASRDEKQNKDSFSPKDERATDKNSCSGEKDNEGNLLGNIVTMHNMTYDAYSPTLAICDIFNKAKDSPTKNISSKLQSNEEENKDEFLIIDLDTCQMERTSKKTNECEYKKVQNNSPANDLILVNLSEAKSDFSNHSNKTDDNEPDSENNFLLNTKDCDNQCHAEMMRKSDKSKKKSGTAPELLVIENTSRVNENRSLQSFKLLQTDDDIKRENCLQNKGMIFQDVTMSNESILSKEMYSADVSFQSSDINDVSFHSNENNETEPDFYMPELYSRHYEEEKNDCSHSAFSKLSSHNSNLDTDNGNQFYDYTINENPSFDPPLSGNQYNNPASHDFYDQQQTQRPHQYNFESKMISNFVAMETKSDTSSMYNSQENTQPYCYKNRVSATSGSNKFSPYSSAHEHTTSNPFFHSSYMPNYRAQYPYNNLQHATDVNPHLSTCASNYSDWNSWRGSAFYEVNLNAFSSVHNMDSQCHHGKDDWVNDAVMPDLYHDPEMNIKSNQTEIDSEATEDADETDDVPIFFDDSADFSACDNLSTISVMSSSCYSDSSSVMTAMSPSDFTPPPSVTNTPVAPTHDINVTDDQRCNYPFINENSRSEPLHLYSPTMLSVTPYKLSHDKIEQNLINYDRSQRIKRYYPSMADMHNSRSGFSVPSTSSKFETHEMFEFPDYRKSNKTQIQSDKISTSTAKSAFIKKNENTPNYSPQPLETYANYVKQEDSDLRSESRRLRHNEPLRQTAIRIMSRWYEEHLDNPYPTKDDKLKMARDGGITVTQVKSWFANKRNRTNNTKPKVQKRAMKEKLKKLFQDLKHSRSDSLDNSHIIQQLSGIIQT